MSRRSIKEYILRQREDYIGEPDRRRRSPDADGGVVYIVNAWFASSHLVFGQVVVREKENEIVAIPRLLPLLCGPPLHSRRSISFCFSWQAY